ncbi:hypothetical protein CDO51_09355 [Natranaerobius trueperi]|uniref:HTH-like domain-containing protein n=1 Tax=Natranaerobius trueperi TaxID=759412 RepID=A0A226BX25_9FIRM|nr:hypothetical protein [Natranaerobius trueperi]OWZ83332.1 hypothetical protein CDO51_09355 [Natranaerobius trueperi]
MLLSSIRQENKYIAVKQLHDEQQLSIVLLCAIAGISRSAYYKWTNRKETKIEAENKILIKEMVKLYEKVDETYGYRRLKRNLNKKLWKKFNHKRYISPYENCRFKISNPQEKEALRKVYSSTSQRIY